MFVPMSAYKQHSMIMQLKTTLKKAIRYFSLSLVLAISLTTNAQQVNYPLNYYSQLFLEKAYSEYDSTITPSFKVIPESWLRLDSVWAYAGNEVYYTRAQDKLYYDHLFEINKDKLHVTIDLLGTQEIGFELSDTSTYSDTTTFYHNARGFLIRGGIGEKFSFETSFLENQIYAPSYIKYYVDDKLVYLGAGRAKIYNAGGFDFAQSGGYLSYSPSETVNLQFGHGKNFIGNGHRSLLLSDNSVNYPYLRGSFRFLKNKLHYHTTFAQLINHERLPIGLTPESRFKIKNASFHYLEIFPIPKLSIGLFESVIWKRYNNDSGTLPVNYASLNPIIFYRTLTSDLQDENKSLIGVNLGFQLTKNIKLYGQFLKDKYQNGYQNGYQFGIRTSNFLTDNLHLLAEYNSVDPYTYAFNDRLQNYSHLNQELAHPLGADFNEFIFRSTYFHNKRVFIDLQLNLINQGKDYLSEFGPTNNGNNIFLDHDSNTNLGYEINRESMIFSSLTFGYLFNPQSNLNAYIRWIHRENDGNTIHTNSFVRIGIRTSIFNNYDDF